MAGAEDLSRFCAANVIRKSCRSSASTSFDVPAVAYLLPGCVIARGCHWPVRGHLARSGFRHLWGPGFVFGL
jgi:hypothetical protein